MAVGVFLVGMPFAAYVGLAPYIQGAWGLSSTGSAGLYSAYLLGAALAAAVVLPRVSHGPPRVVLAATGAVALSHLAFALAPGPPSAAVGPGRGGRRLHRGL